MTAGRSVRHETDGAARKLSGPARGEMALAPVLAALSDPVRLKIVCMLANGCELSCGSFGLPIAKSTLTHHLKVLRDAGVITQRPVGTSRMTCLRREGPRRTLSRAARLGTGGRPQAARPAVREPALAALAAAPPATGRRRTVRSALRSGGGG